MSCGMESHRILDYFEGELGAEARREVEGHLAWCEACAALLADFELAAEAFRDLPPERSESSAETVLIRARRARAHGRRGWVAAAAAVILLVGFGMWNRSSAPGPGVPEPDGMSLQECRATAYRDLACRSLLPCADPKDCSAGQAPLLGGSWP